MAEHLEKQDVGRVVYSPAEVAMLLGVSRDKAYELINNGVIPHKKLGRLKVIPCTLFHQWLNEYSTTPRRKRRG